MKVEENVLLSRLTTFKIGGPARYVLTLASPDEARAAVTFARERSLPLIPLGGGSNILAPDGGIEAVLVRFSSHAIRPLDVTDRGVTVSVDAGSSWDGLVAHATSEGWWGIENLSSIPGTVGAAAVQNIGAYGAALEQVVQTVEAFDTRDMRSVQFTKKECQFGYRTSIFKKEPDRFLITSVTFNFGLIPMPRLSYRDVEAHFEETHEAPTLRNIRNAIMNIREKKFPPLATYGTAGSFFLNPVLSERDARIVQEKFPGIPLFPMPEGGVKVPFAWFLDKVLNLKGRRVGSSFLWEAQPLVIATEGEARASDVIALADSVRNDAKEKIGIAVEVEVRIL